MYLKNAFTGTIFLKAAALIIGFLFWTIIGDSFQNHVWIKVPIAFYNGGQKKIAAPATIAVELRGKRNHLRQIDTSTLAVHIDANRLKVGPNHIPLTADLLFLPSTLQVGDSIPTNLLIMVQG
jgi:hypothetical protein